MTGGGVAERSIALVLKTGDRKVRGFESHPRRHSLLDAARPALLSSRPQLNTGRDRDEYPSGAIPETRRLVRAEREIPPLDFYAAFPVKPDSHMAEAIAAIARELSRGAA